MVPRVGRPGRESIDRFIRRSVGAMSRLVASVRTQHTGSAQRSQDERRTKLTASASGSLVCFVIRARLLARPGTTLPRGRRLRWLARRAHRRCETVDSDGGGDDGHRAQVHDLDDRRKLPSGPPPPGTRPTAPSSRAPTPSARSPRRFCCTASAEPDRRWPLSRFGRGPRRPCYPRRRQVARISLRAARTQEPTDATC
jgi:hypothetical protein